jgi:hypothetical protein
MGFSAMVGAIVMCALIGAALPTPIVLAATLFTGAARFASASVQAGDRFLKKAAPKLFRDWARTGETSTAQINKVFLLLFVHKK